MLSGEQVGLKTPPVSAFQTFEDLLAAFFQQFDYAVALVVNEANRTDWVHKELEPFRSFQCSATAVWKMDWTWRWAVPDTIQPAL